MPKEIEHIMVAGCPRCDVNCACTKIGLTASGKLILYASCTDCRIDFSFSSTFARMRQQCRESDAQHNVSTDPIKVQHLDLKEWDDSDAVRH